MSMAARRVLNILLTNLRFSHLMLGIGVLPKLKKSLLASIFVLSGCDALDCVVNNHPEFSANNVRTATLNQVFEDTIKVSISNSFMDNDYLHTFEVEGELAPGISFETKVREITFSGTPTMLGDYPFRLTVFSRARDTNFDEDPPERLCSDTESRDMVFSVVQGF